MPSRPPKKAAKKDQSSDQALSNKAQEAAGKIKSQRIGETGLTSRVRGHVSAQTKRTQSKRDAK